MKNLNLLFPMRIRKLNKILFVGNVLFVSSLFPQHAKAELNWTSLNKVDADTLVLYHMDEKGLTLKDSGPNMLDATLGNVASRSAEPSTWLIPPAGAYLIPTGTTETGTTGMAADVVVRDVDFSKGLTISMWYRALPDEEHGGELFQIEGPRVRVVTDNYGTRNNGRLLFEAAGTNVYDKPPIVDFGADNEWRHLAVVYDPVNATAEDGGTWSFYLDGELVSTTEDKTDLSAKTSFPLRVGGNVFNNGPLQGGCIDEFLISNRVITDFSRPAGL